MPSHELRAESINVSEDEVKAAYIYNLIDYLNWSKELRDKKDYIIGIIADDAVHKRFLFLNKKKNKGKKLRVVHFENVEDISDCHVLYIHSSRKKQMSDVLEKSKSLHALTVSDSDGFLDKGGMMNFVKKSKKLRFEFNLKEAKKADIRISSRLLRLATRVIR